MLEGLATGAPDAIIPDGHSLSKACQRPDAFFSGTGASLRMTFNVAMCRFMSFPTRNPILPSGLRSCLGTESDLRAVHAHRGV